MGKSNTRKKAGAVKEPAAEYARSKQIPNFFGQPMLRGKYAFTGQARLDPQDPALFYSHPNGEIWAGDARAWLRSLESESVDLIFADPPYNLKKAEWDTFESQQDSVDWSMA